MIIVDSGFPAFSVRMEPEFIQRKCNKKTGIMPEYPDLSHIEVQRQGKIHREIYVNYCDLKKLNLNISKYRYNNNNTFCNITDRAFTDGFDSESNSIIFCRIQIIPIDRSRQSK